MRLAAVLALGTTAMLVASACATGEGSAFDGAFEEASSAGAPGALGADGGTSASEPDLTACATETKTVEPAPLDVFVMLDVSGSMMGRTGKLKTGPTKWAAVKSALETFLEDPKNAGIGVGLQVFPIVHPGARACSSDADCTHGGVDYGSCFLKACDYDDHGGYLPCETSAECPKNKACLPLGECRRGSQVFGRCVVGGMPCKTGTCVALTTSTCSRKECFVDDYDGALVPIGQLPGAAAAIMGAIEAIPDPPDTALTPTSAALSGGLSYAKKLASAEPSHAVVLVLVTDGLPTRCLPYDGPSIGQIAAAALPSVKTFVIGVFADAEQATARKNLDAIAAGGGTDAALLVSTNGDVSADLQKALAQVRDAALPCDYRVPTPSSGAPDYDSVNVRFSPAGVPSSLIPRRDGAAACDASGGWYYETAPGGDAPAKLVLCPSTCEQVRRSSEGSKVDVLLGCKSVVK